MNTAISERHVDKELKGWILYDGDCSLCRNGVARVEKLFTRRGFDFAPLQAPWVRLKFGLSKEDLLSEMRVLTADGKIFGGADAVIELARQVWWAWPLYAFSKLPGAKELLRVGYRRIAQRRHCQAGACNFYPTAPLSGGRP